MLWSVAARFSFTRTELRDMGIRDLVFWYQGHKKMVDEENAAVGG